MLTRFSKWGRLAAYLVVLTGIPVWLLNFDGPGRGAGADSGPPLVILVAAYAAYVAGSLAEQRRRANRRRKLLNDNRESM